MSNICKLTGKQPRKGHNVSHSNRKTRMWQAPNMQKTKLLNPATGKTETVVLSAKGIKTLKRWLAEGKKFDLRELT